jgi:NAD(P)-dependent dehydrogenase (short-subunit alcohol dehydrogenase family)
MTGGSLAGRRVLVVGASAGIGRAVGLRAVSAGATVVVSARRQDRLDELIAESGGGLAVACDVTDDDACRELLERAGAELGGIDVLFYAVGRAPLRRMADSSIDEWQQVIDTNLLGLQRIVTAAVPRMRSGGIVAVMSSETVAKPREGLGAYGASKAALEASLDAWRIEHPELRFSCLAVGATQPTEFGVAFDGESLGPAMASWSRHGLMQEAHMATDEVASVCVDLLGSALANPTVGVDRLVLRSPSPVLNL